MSATMPRPFITLLLILSVTLLLLPDTPACSQENQSAAVRAYNVAAALQNASLYPRAAERWTEFIQKHPKDTRIDRATYYLGICQLHTKKYPESTATFKSLIAKFPKFADLDGAHYNVAMCSYQVAVASKKPADFLAAAAAFDSMIKAFPKSAHAPRASYFQESLITLVKNLRRRRLPISI